MDNNNTKEMEYIELFPNYQSFENAQEWKKEGDTFQEFSLYEDYPPSYSTCHTIISE